MKTTVKSVGGRFSISAFRIYVAPSQIWLRVDGADGDLVVACPLDPHSAAVLGQALLDLAEQAEAAMNQRAAA
jgi:hypothetical protein